MGGHRTRLADVAEAQRTKGARGDGIIKKTEHPINKYIYIYMCVCVCVCVCVKY